LIREVNLGIVAFLKKTHFIYENFFKPAHLLNG